MLTLSRAKRAKASAGFSDDVTLGAPGFHMVSCFFLSAPSHRESNTTRENPYCCNARTKDGGMQDSFAPA